MDVVRGNADPVHAPRRGRGGLGAGSSPILDGLGRAARSAPQARTRPAPGARPPPIALIERDGRTWLDATLLRPSAARSDHDHATRSLATSPQRIAERSARQPRHLPRAHPDAGRPARPAARRTCPAATSPTPSPPAGAGDKDDLQRRPSSPTSRIVTAYNDMLSAHQPLERFPTLIKAGGARGGRRRPVRRRRAGDVRRRHPGPARAWSCRCSRRDVIAHGDRGRALATTCSTRAL